MIEKGHLRPLLALQTRELVRNTSYFIFVIIFPFGMAGMFLLMSEMMKGQADAPDFSPFVMPMALFLAVTGTALTMTAGPLAEVRQSGALRVLSTTPIRKADYLMTYLAVRLIMATLQILVIVGASVLLNLLPFRDIGRVFVVSLLGLVMFLALGYLMGGWLSSPQLATNLGALVQLLALFLSGLAIPFAILPDWLTNVIRWIPSTLFGDLIFWASKNPLQQTGAMLSTSIVLAVTAVLVFLAVRGFKWDVE